MHFTIGEKLTIGGILIVIASLVWIMISVTNEAIKECKALGGQWVHDGTYTYIWQIVDSKTGAGILVPYANYACTVK